MLESNRSLTDQAFYGFVLQAVLLSNLLRDFKLRMLLDKCTTVRQWRLVVSWVSLLILSITFEYRLNISLESGLTNGNSWFPNYVIKTLNLHNLTKCAKTLL